MPGPTAQRSQPGVSRVSRGHICSAPLKSAFQASVGTDAETANRRKYNDVLKHLHIQIQPAPTEKTGTYGTSAASFLKNLAKRLVDMIGDPRERQWFHQRLSLVVVSLIYLSHVCPMDNTQPAYRYYCLLVTHFGFFKCKLQ